MYFLASSIELKVIPITGGSGMLGARASKGGVDSIKLFEGEDDMLKYCKLSGLLAIFQQVAADNN